MKSNMSDLKSLSYIFPHTIKMHENPDKDHKTYFNNLSLTFLVCIVQNPVWCFHVCLYSQKKFSVMPVDGKMFYSQVQLPLDSSEVLERKKGSNRWWYERNHSPLNFKRPLPLVQAYAQRNWESFVSWLYIFFCYRGNLFKSARTASPGWGFPVIFLNSLRSKD
jgi:hypothetical protein